MIRKLVQELFTLGELEIFEVKTGRYRATDQAKSIFFFPPEGLGGKPYVAWYDQLGERAFIGLHAYQVAFIMPVGMDEMHLQNIPVVEVPDLIGFEAVESGKVSGGEHEINGRTQISRPFETFRQDFRPQGFIRAVGFVKKSSFRMRFQLERFDPIFARKVLHPLLFMVHDGGLPRKSFHRLLLIIPKKIMDAGAVGVGHAVMAICRKYLRGLGANFALPG